MRDEDHGDALGTQLAQGLEEDLRLMLGQRRGGLVEHEDPWVLAVDLGDLHHLGLSHRQIADQRVGIDRCREAREQRVRVVVEACGDR